MARVASQGDSNHPAILDASDDAFFVLDPNGCAILDVNQKMTELFGYTLEEARRITMGDISSGAPQSGQTELPVWKTGDAGKPRSFE